MKMRFAFLSILLCCLAGHAMAQNTERETVEASFGPPGSAAALTIGNTVTINTDGFQVGSPRPFLEVQSATSLVTGSASQRVALQSEVNKGTAAVLELLEQRIKELQNRLDESERAQNALVEQLSAQFIRKLDDLPSQIFFAEEPYTQFRDRLIEDTNIQLK